MKSIKEFPEICMKHEKAHHIVCGMSFSKELFKEFRCEIHQGGAPYYFEFFRGLQIWEMADEFIDKSFFIYDEEQNILTKGQI